MRRALIALAIVGLPASAWATVDPPAFKFCSDDGMQIDVIWSDTEAPKFKLRGNIIEVESLADDTQMFELKNGDWAVIYKGKQYTDRGCS
jgi:hypothetical protein